MVEIVPGVSRTFNEFLLLPNRTTAECTPDQVHLGTSLVRHAVGAPSSIRLSVPFTSAIMQAVSSPGLAVALARSGGLSFLHHNQSVEDQADAVRFVKNFKAGFVVSDTTVRPTDALRHLVGLMKATGHNTAAVTEDGSPHGRFVGLVTDRDFHPDRHDLGLAVGDRMRPVDALTCGKEGITLSEANTTLWEERLDCLPVVDGTGHLQHLVFRSDYAEHKQFPGAVVDAAKRFRVGAGVNTHDYRDRVPALVAAGADVLCLDSSDGYSDWQAEALRWVKREFPEVPIGGGNVVDGGAFEFLADAGADFVKVGIGGGSICITRDQKGIGRGQASAVLDVAQARAAYAQRTGEYVPICSDGGLLHDYHMALALAMGADFVMMGRYFARFDQSPGKKVRIGGSVFKEYWGEGSSRARNWQRYDQGEDTLHFEEGVDGYVPYVGDLGDALALTVAKIKATMASCGAATVPAFQSTARVTLVSEQSYQENAAAVAIRESTDTTLD
ncbi:IMP dehydrogenase [Actinosynnema sp. NPDC023587]|uniref:IMP dehydrogenase n=1 Tax=Actinosynnema sp. NPDC023587 TaxID=3154695 RepID=UPI0033EC8CBD